MGRKKTNPPALVLRLPDPQAILPFILNGSPAQAGGSGKRQIKQKPSAAACMNPHPLIF
jgi:hypothetical protein